MENKKRLVVFVHGWGAGAKDWWGNTNHTLTTHPDLSSVDLYFYRYVTSRTPRGGLINKLFELGSSAEHHQKLGELGQDLWSNIAHRVGEKSYASVSLFGHSFGGIVVADALCHALNRRKQNCTPEEEAALRAINSIALCCSPIAGAKLADYYAAAIRVFGKNPHVQNLRATDELRMLAVDGLLNYLSDKPPLLTLFRAAGDEVVQSNEIYAPFRIGNLAFREHVLKGKHSACVQNLSPADEVSNENLGKILSWIRGPVVRTAADAHVIREKFDDLIRRLRAEVELEPFRSWKTLRDGSQVTSVYLLRVFLQRLVHAAAQMTGALGSANLWVAHIDEEKHLHLRSEEREGFFRTKQLVLHTGNISAGKVQVVFRANRVYTGPKEISENSVAAQACLAGKPVLVAMRKTDYESDSETDTGITHVLGTPLFVVPDFTNLNPDMDGTPLALTIDFHFREEPDGAQVEQLFASAQKLTDAFQALERIWDKSDIRLLLTKGATPPESAATPAG